MYTRQLLPSLSQLAGKTVGVYAADCIPTVLARPAYIIANMDDYRKGGSHLIAICIDNQCNLYPLVSSNHIDRLRRNCTRYQWNKRRLQTFKPQCAVNIA